MEKYTNKELPFSRFKRPHKKVKQNRLKLKHVTVKMIKSKRQKLLKAMKEIFKYKENNVKITANFSYDITQARKVWNDIDNINN